MGWMRMWVLAAVFSASVGFSADRELVASCDGKAKIGGKKTAIEANVYRGKGSLVLEASGLAARKLVTRVQTREQGLYLVYFSKQEPVSLWTFGDDMGGMSKLVVGKKEYELTCQIW